MVKVATVFQLIKGTFKDFTWIQHEPNQRFICYDLDYCDLDPRVTDESFFRSYLPRVGADPKSGRDVTQVFLRVRGSKG